MPRGLYIDSVVSTNSTNKAALAAVTNA